MAPAEAPSISVLGSLLCSATAACTAEVLSLPLDTAKVRLMLQQKSASGDGALKYRGLVGTMGTILKEEGPSALWKGLVPGLHRQLLFGGLRLGLYQPVKDLVAPLGGPLIAQKMAAGLTTGAIAISVANPADLVKVRLQAQGRSSGPAKYSSALQAYRIIAKEEGLRGLWTGYMPNLARNSIMNCVELVGYDVSKETLVNYGFNPDGVQTHLIGGLSAGFMATVIANPLDVMKNRLMADSTGQFSGMLQCGTATMRAEGPLAFYKGFIALFARVGWFNVAAFVVLEQARAAYIRL